MIRAVVTLSIPACALALCLSFLSPACQAQENNPTTAAPPAKSGWEQEVSQLGAMFKQHYEAGNAEALAALFTDSGEFIDAERTVYSGRESIQAEFGALFETSAERKMELVVDAVRQVSEGVVIEDGHAWLQMDAESSTTVSQYCSLMVRVGEQWKIASLRDIESDFASPADRLDSLSWMLGDWIDESDAGVVEYSFSRSDDNNYIVGTYLMRNKEEDDFTGSIRIGWNPARKQFQSWTFDSEGGVATGHWDEIEAGWIIKNSGIRADGVVGTATNYYEIVDDGRVLWKSFDRHVGGEKQDDVEVTLVRKPPVPGQETPANENSENQ